MRSTYVVRLGHACVRREKGRRADGAAEGHIRLALDRATAARRQTVHVPSDSVGFARALRTPSKATFGVCATVDLQGVCGSLSATTTDEVAERPVANG